MALRMQNFGFDRLKAIVHILCTAAIQACRYLLYSFVFPPPQATAAGGPGPAHVWGFMITLRHTTFSRISLDGWSAQCRDLYLITHNSHMTKTSMPPARFEPAIPASKQPQTDMLDHVNTGIGLCILFLLKIMSASIMRCLAVATSTTVHVTHIHYTHSTKET